MSDTRRANCLGRRGAAPVTVTIRGDKVDGEEVVMVSDDGSEFDGDEMCEGDFAENDAKIAAEERAEHYRGSGRRVKIVHAPSATVEPMTKPGRPRSEYPARYQVRLHPEQIAAYKAAAAAEGRELQNWLRRTLDAAAKRATKDKP